jgi:O-antigen biosynthesis protein
MQFQSEMLGGNRNAYVSLVQDYEANFSRFSSAFLLATSMYDSAWPKVSIFNSAELACFYRLQGHDVSASETFEPIMNRTLRDVCLKPEPTPKERRILFYGRPEVLRNCYFLARTALEIWSEIYSRSAEWQVISVGQRHRPFRLRNGQTINVLGKLSLPGYAYELSRAAVGLSLMASPHPSYPPLEMAHFGALTVTNSFRCKNLSTWHENITSVEQADPETIARAVMAACASFDADPESGRKGTSLKPHYLLDFDSRLVERMTNLIESCVSSRSVS